MAKVRTSINPLYTGAAGGYTFYVRKAEQVVRQRKNNSNYGADASRTEAQQIRRVKWANLVNFFKCIKSWQAKAYESRNAGQTDYNIFMSLNIPYSLVALTKEMAINGCSLVAGYTVSRGSLPKIDVSPSADSGHKGVEIALSNAITSSTTVGDFAADIIANNPEFQDGDNLAIIVFRNPNVSDQYPYSQSFYSEITLNTQSQVLLSSIRFAERLSKSSRGYLQFEDPDIPGDEVGFVFIHTRRVAGSLQVSTQSIIMNANGYWNEYVNDPWVQQCIESYGVNADVPLDPSFNLATITAVTANGSAVRDFDELQGSQQLRIVGRNLNTGNVRLMFNNSEYTPLEIGDDYLGYLISDNGDVQIYLNDRPYMNFSVEDVTIPEEAPFEFVMSQQLDASNRINRVQLHDANCLNYPYRYNEDYPYFVMQVGQASNPFDDTDTSNYEFINCTANVASTSGGAAVLFTISVTDTEEVAYIKYKDFIIAVFNYSN